MWCSNHAEGEKGYRHGEWPVALLLCGVMAGPAWFPVSLVRAEMKIMPAVTLSERYDSNVLYVPSGTVVSGRTKEDFVTTVAPQVRFLNKDPQAETDITAGASGNAFVNNRDLDFVSVNLVGAVNLTRWIREVIPGAKLRIGETFLYTPEQPNFVSPTAPRGTQNVFANGIQTVRATVHTNNASVAGEYMLDRGMGLRASYAHSIFRVDKVLTDQPARVGLFNTTLERWTAGPTLRVARGENLTMNYINTTMDFSTVGANSKANVVAGGLEAEYGKVTPDWSATASGGATLLEQGNLAFFTGKLEVAGAYDRETRIGVTVSRSLSPGFFGPGTGGVLISNVGGVSIEQKLSNEWNARGTANYAHSETAPVNVVKSSTIMASGQLTYGFNQSVSASLFYQYSRFEISSTGAPDFMVNRNLLTLSITGKW